MKYQCFTVEVDQAVAQIQLCRPEALNTMIPEFWTELPAIVRGSATMGAFARQCSRPRDGTSVQGWICPLSPATTCLSPMRGALTSLGGKESAQSSMYSVPSRTPECPCSLRSRAVASAEGSIS